MVVVSVVSNISRQMSHFCNEYDDATCSISTLCMISVILSGVGGSSNFPILRNSFLRSVLHKLHPVTLHNCVILIFHCSNAGAYLFSSFLVYS